MRKYLLPAIILLCASVGFGQTTITVTTTPVKTGVKRPGINLGPDTYYGQGQVRRNLGVAGGGYYAKPVWQTTYLCTSGGTTNTTTSWYAGQVSYSADTPYGTNFWSGATYEAISQTGALLGTGTITASTAQTTSAGITFTLGTALTAACQQNSGGTAGQDVLIVSKRNTGNDYSQVTPFGENPQVSSSATFNTTSYPTGFTASVALPNGTTASVYPDASTNNQVNLTSTTAVPYTNFNGTYTVQYWLACSTGTCSTSWQWGRNAGAFSGCSGTDTGTTTWVLKTHTCTPTETGTQTTSSQFSLNATSANVLFNGQDVIEGTAISPANVTAYRDAVVKELRAINPGVIRHMYPDLWASTIQDEITAAGTRGWPNVNSFNSVGNANGAVFGTPTGYAEQLELCYVVGSDCQLTMGKFTQPGDMTALMNFLGVTNATGYSTSYGSTWNALYAAKGLHIYLAYGNEPWNSQAGGTLESGNGYAYGYLVGQLMPAFYAASGYNSSVDFATAGSWAVQSQSAGAYGFTQQFLNQAGCATGTPTHCPAFVELAPYTIDSLDTVTPTTVDADEVAEVINGDSAGTSGNSSSMLNSQTYTTAHWPVNVSIYEYAYYSPTGGTGTPTQLQMNQISAGVGMGLNMSEHALLMIRDSGVTGPTSFFSFADYVASSSLGVAGTYWVGERLVSCGPGVIGTCNAISNPAVIAFKMINAAIGTKTNLLTQTVSGTGTTFSYAGGQGGTIPANSAVATVNCFPFADSSSNYAMICYNNTTSSQTVNFAGAAAPLSSTSVTYSTLGGSTNAVTDNNLQATLASPTVVVAQPTTTAGTGFNTLTLQPRQLWVGTYALSGGGTTVATPTFSPAAGSYSSAQTVTITSSTSGATICYTTNGTTPAAATAGTCSVGTTLANGGTITVSSTQTVMALGTLSGDTNSSVASAAYTITGGGSTVTTIALSNPNYCYVGQSCIQTATMGTTAATGTVTFYQAGTSIGHRDPVCRCGYVQRKCPDVGTPGRRYHHERHLWW